MADANRIDGILVQWGERLFYPANRMVRGQKQPKFRAAPVKERAAWVRERIAATAVRRAPQVMVKITGGGRGMVAIAAHLRYISKSGRLEMETELGEKLTGKDAVRELAEEWRVSGSLIEEESTRRDGLNVMLSMPRGTDPMTVLRAAREFAKLEFADHKYAMVLHDHQANPHVHISVRRESKYGKRLNPRKADLQRWRETLAEKLREWGVEAEASRQPTRAVNRDYPAIWQVKAKKAGRLRTARGTMHDKVRADGGRDEAATAWKAVVEVLSSSADPDDRSLASKASEFLRGHGRHRNPGREPIDTGSRPPTSRGSQLGR